MWRRQHALGMGADVACLMPSKDQPNQITAMAAAHVLFELTSLIAERLATANSAG